MTHVTARILLNLLSRLGSVSPSVWLDVCFTASRAFSTDIASRRVFATPGMFVCVLVAFCVALHQGSRE